MSTFRDTQALFHRLVTAPENVGKTLSSLGIARDEVDAHFAGDARLDAVARLDIYADMYFFRIRDVLREQFERLLAELGDAAFHDLVVDYLIACPPRTPSLRDVGERLPGFIAGHGVSRDRPWLSDLARLEWLRLDVFDDTDAAVLTVDEVRLVPPDEFGDLRLQLIPAHRLAGLRWRVDEPEFRPERTTFIVWRRGLDVFHRPLLPLEGAAIELARPGCTFGAICDLLGLTRDEEQAAGAAFTLLSQWVGDGLLHAP